MKYSAAIAQATVDAMKADPSVHVFGAGVADPKGIFGTTYQANMEYPGRVHETPLSENALTGALVGMVLGGIKPIFVHARVDFLMLTMEHLVNTVAKWGFAHGRPERPMPMVIRAITGQGWGQGPQHSQALHAMLGHVPGLSVMLPYTPADAYMAIKEAVEIGRPTIILEHRRLYDTEGEITWSPSFYAWSAKQNIALNHPSADVTIVAVSASVLDAVEASDALRHMGIAADVFVCRRIPIRWDLIETVVAKTGRLVVVDTGLETCGLSSEIIAGCARRGLLKVPPISITPPFYPCPTSSELEKVWYPTASNVINACLQVIGSDIRVATIGAAVRDGRSSPF